MPSSCAQRPSSEAWPCVIGALVAALLPSCRSDDTVVVRFADGVVVAPTHDVAAYLPAISRFGAELLIVPWIETDTDIGALVTAAAAVEVPLVLGLTPARRAEEEWNTPDAPSLALSEALERVAAAGAGAAGLHLELRGPLPPSAAYLDATLAVVRTVAGGRPISVGVDARRLSVERLQEAGFPPPPTLTIEALDRGADRDAWARAWAEALGDRVERVLVHTADQSAREQADLERLAALLAGRVELWASVDAHSTVAATVGDALSRAPRLRTQTEIRPRASRLHPHAARVLVRGIEDYAPDAILSETPVAHAIRSTALDPALEAKARDADARLWRCCWRDGQIVSVYDGRTRADLGANRWQEDACWITGLYTAAASFRAAVTGAPDDAARARAAFAGLHKLASATPLDGEVVRNTQRALYDQPRAVDAGSSTKKRWRRSPERELYWVGDISVDQLSGWFLGMTVFHDLVADAAERAAVVSDVRAVLDAFLADDLHARGYGDARTTFGDLRAQPVLALAFFQVGRHLTDDPSYGAAFDRLMRDEGMHWQIANVLALYHAAERYGSDHFYSSGLLPLLAYESDEGRRALFDAALDMVHALKRPHGDAYADMVHGVLRPTDDASRRARLELSAYTPSFLENARFLATRLGPPGGPYHPIAQRPAAELDFDYVPPGEQRLRGGLEGRFSGAGFLLTYWMGRYFERL